MGRVGPNRLPEETDPAAGTGGVFGLIGRVAVRVPWLVIGVWIALAVGLAQIFPPLAVLAQRAPAAILPASAPSAVASRAMTEAFKEASSENILLVVLTSDKGLGSAAATSR